MFLRLFSRVKTDLENVGVRPSFSASLIEQRDRYRISEQEMAFLSGQMYGAGFDTTASTLMWWLLAMVAHPEVQHRAQVELDSVVGRARLPTFADAPHLPYVRAMFKEILRWRPTIERGMPHTTAADDWYEGMFIPKGSACMANTWHCNHDRAVFGDDAGDFKPERHLDSERKGLLPAQRTNGEGHVTYGFGRRICVGKHLANYSLFISTAQILWTATLGCARDENDKELPPDTNAFADKGVFTLVILQVYQFWEVAEFLVCGRPAPYDCIIAPRFPEVLFILAEESGSFED